MKVFVYLLLLASLPVMASQPTGPRLVDLKIVPDSTTRSLLNSGSVPPGAELNFIVSFKVPMSTISGLRSGTITLSPYSGEILPSQGQIPLSSLEMERPGSIRINFELNPNMQAGEVFTASVKFISKARVATASGIVAKLAIYEEFTNNSRRSHLEEAQVLLFRQNVQSLIYETFDQDQHSLLVTDERVLEWQRQIRLSTFDQEYKTREMTGEVVQATLPENIKEQIIKEYEDSLSNGAADVTIEGLDLEALKNSIRSQE